MMEKVCLGLLLLRISLCTAFTRGCSIVEEDYLIKANCQRLNLTEIPQDLNKSIQILDLRENKLTIIANKSLKNYTNLLALNLDRNKIRRIDSEGFYGLEKLQNLTLSKNYLNISRVGKLLLGQITQITELDISDNCDNCNSFVGDNNMKLYLRYPDSEFRKLTKLKNLSIDLYGYPDFGTGFKKLPIQSLIFNKCFIRHLKNDTFKHFPDSVLKIQLTSCEIINIDCIQNGLLSPFPSLSWLDMSSTEITLTKALGLLYPLRNKSMEVINFGHMWNTWTNRTKAPFAITLTHSIMEHLNTICVKTLILADNNIVDVLPNSLFESDYLQCREHIDLSGNRFGLSAVFPNELELFSQRLTNLRIFDFSYLPLRFHDAKFLPFSKNIEIKPNTPHDPDIDSRSDCAAILGRHTWNITIYLPRKLEYIRITHVLGAPPLKNLILRNISSLKYVDMSYYRLLCFPDIYIEETENNLEYLDVSGIDCKMYYEKPTIPLFRKLKYILMRNTNFYRAVEKGENVFKFMPNLQYLDLSDNQLFGLPIDFFIALKNLSSLVLSRNHFRYIPIGLTMLENLTSLHVTGNRLFTIFTNYTTWFDSQRVKYGKFDLQLDYNDFSCTCQYTDFVRWLNTTNVQFDAGGNYRCRVSNGSIVMTNDVLGHFHELFADCYAVSWLRVGIAIIVSFFCILLPVAVVFNFRWRIIFYCYRKCRKIVELSMNLSYKYDVYVSYGYDGYSWVQEFLVKQLEDTWGLKICIEDRDFVLGRSNYEQIANSIEKSRHIIFVITSDFMSKPFAIYEIDRARDAKIARTLQNIIIITYDFNVESMPMELQTLWSDVSVIEWPKHLDETESATNNLRTRLLLNF